MNQTIKFNRLLLALVSSLSILELTKAIVVDGEKKVDISPTKHQSDEKSMIDSFNTKTCGMADPNLQEHEFISMAREGQFPWIVSFQIKTSPDESSKKADDLHFCCGSFISDKWVLSAAHCFASESIQNYLSVGKLKVVAGSHRVSSRDKNNRNLTIARIFSHSQFDKSNPVGFDIALVELNDKVTFSHKRSKSNFGEQKEPFMNAICLPLKDKKYNFNETARIAGWGLSNEKDASSMPSKLLTTDILIGNKDKCIEDYSKALKSDRPKHQKEKYDDFICADNKRHRDACQSDSGGPLMQFSNGKAVLIGVVSYGIGCAQNVSGLYTRTSAYINWVKDITKSGKGASVEFKLIEPKAVDKSKVSSTTPFPSDAIAPATTAKTTASRRPKAETQETGSVPWLSKSEATSKDHSDKKKSASFGFLD